MFFLFPFFISALLGTETEDGGLMLRGFSHLHPTIDHAHTTLNLGLGLGEKSELFPMVATNISLSDTYFLEACFGAGELNDIDGGLSQYSIGLGNYDAIKSKENLYYSIALSLRKFNSTYISSSALVLEALLEQRVDNLYLGLGIDLISQDYNIFSGSKYTIGSDRIYHATMIVYARTGLLDIRVCGLPGALNINLSLNLNMEKK